MVQGAKELSEFSGGLFLSGLFFAELFFSGGLFPARQDALLERVRSLAGRPARLLRRECRRGRGGGRPMSRGGKKFSHSRGSRECIVRPRYGKAAHRSGRR